MTDSFLTFGPDAWFTLTGTDVIKCNRLPETDDLSVFTWIKLPAGSKNIQTIAANRATGCAELSLRRRGFAFYVNSWMASDLKLKVRADFNLRVRHGTSAACNPCCCMPSVCHCPFNAAGLEWA